MADASLATVTAAEWAVGGAIFASIISGSTKIFSDILDNRRKRRSIAAALSGEIGGYLVTLNVLETAAYIKQVADSKPLLIDTFLAGLHPLPSGHPVFDKISDQIGMLPPVLALEVSRFYNVISGLRLMYSHIQSDVFRGWNIDFKKAYIRTIAQTLEASNPSKQASSRFGKL